MALTPIPPGAAHVEIPFQVKTYDVDSYRHVHNAVYIRWLEDLRMALLDKYFPLERFMADGIGPVLTKTCIEYRRAIRLTERPVGRMWVSRLGGARFELLAEFVVGDVVHAHAEQGLAVIHLESGRPVRAPAAFLQAMTGQ